MTLIVRYWKIASLNIPAYLATATNRMMYAPDDKQKWGDKWYPASIVFACSSSFSFRAVHCHWEAFEPLQRETQINVFRAFLLYMVEHRFLVCRFEQIPANPTRPSCGSAS